MIFKTELSYKELRKGVNNPLMKFKTTEELDALSGLIGQKRAVRAVSFGLSVNSKGHNLYVAGTPGSGRTTYTLEEIRHKAKELPTPDDWAYVYNFEEPQAPTAIRLPAGMGKGLEEQMEDTIEELKITLSKAFENSQYEDNKAQLIKAFQEQVNGFMEELKVWAATKSFMVKRTPQGFMNLPLMWSNDEEKKETQEENQGKKPRRTREQAAKIETPAQDGEKSEKSEQKIKTTRTYKKRRHQREMTQEEFENMSEKTQQVLQKNSEEVSQKTLEILRHIRELEKGLKEKIKELEREICQNAIEPILSELKQKFGLNDVINKWLGDLSDDITENFGMFIAAARDENAEMDFSRYMINVLVSQEPGSGAPVIRETNPNYYNLIGKTEYESRQGYLCTDFRHIVAGAFHKANGGYLILEAEELLRQFMSWDALKRVLRTEELAIENLGEQLGFVPVSSLRPSPIPINVKVVVVGTHWLYYLLNIYDPEFQKIFKVKADFDTDMPRNHDTEMQMASFVASFASREGKIPFDVGAVKEVIEWSCRMSGHQEKMSTQFNKIAEVLIEATQWAVTDKKELVMAAEVRKAIDEKIFRSNLVEERIYNAFEEGTIRIDTKGEAVGQINGLSVIDMIDYTFGHPTRITANVFIGQEGIVNIEREVKMTGPIHNKGLLILQSYLGRLYAQDMPISIAARLTFEQTYSGIEGDSASSTELYCLLSALADVPLRQDIAVTGSVDQFGNVQPIGGVNEKVEGFFKYCQAGSLTGTQGVMIPRQNVKHLMLNHETVEAVKAKKFHIYAIDTTDEGMEILMGMAAGEPGTWEEHDESTLHGRIKSRLKKWAQRSSKIKNLLEKESKETKKNKKK